MEPRSGEVLTETQKSQFGETLRAWLDRVSAAFGVSPMIYTSTWAWGQMTLRPAWASRYPLWVADYSAPVSIPTPWSAWTYHQYTSSGAVPGIIGSVDLNRYRS